MRIGCSNSWAFLLRKQVASVSQWLETLVTGRAPKLPDTTGHVFPSQVVARVSFFLRADIQQGFHKCLCFGTLEHEYAKILLHEVDACNVGRYNRVGIGTKKWRWKAGNWEDDLIYCLSLKTMNWMTTMDLRTSDTFANVIKANCPFLHPRRQQRSRSREIEIN